MSWKSFYENISALRQWWSQSELRGLERPFEELPYTLEPVWEAISGLKSSPELQSLLEKPLDLQPTVGLCGFQSAGKTELVRSFLPLRSPFRSFFLSTHRDTTSPIVYIHFGQERQVLEYRFLSGEGRGSLADLWGRIYPQGDEEARRLYEMFYQILQTFPATFSIDVSQREAAFFEVLALSTVLKDLSHVSEKLSQAESSTVEEVFWALSESLSSLGSALEALPQIRKLARSGPFPGESQLSPMAQKLLSVAYLFSVLVDSVSLWVPFESSEEIGLEEFVLVDAPGFAECGVEKSLWGTLTNWMAHRNRYLIGARATYEFDILLLCVNSANLGAQATGDLAKLYATLSAYESDLSKVQDWLAKRVILVFTVLDRAVEQLIWRPSESMKIHSTSHKVQEMLQIPYAQEEHTLYLPPVPFLLFQVPRYLAQARDVLSPELLEKSAEEVRHFFEELRREMLGRSSVEAHYVRDLVQVLLDMFLVEPSSFQKFVATFFRALVRFIDLRGVEAARSRLFGGHWQRLEEQLSHFAHLPFEELLRELRSIADPKHVVEHLEVALEKSRCWTRRESSVSVQELREAWQNVFFCRIPERELQVLEEFLQTAQRESEPLRSILLGLRE